MDRHDDPRSRVPAMGELLERPELEEAIASHGRGAVKQALESHLEELRSGLTGSSAADGARLDGAAITTAVATRMAGRALSLRHVINATGVVLHTNLGRAPLSRAALDAVHELAGRYLNVEMDLDSGERGKRAAGIAAKLARLTGCAASLVVNNNAAAVLLTLDTLGRGREVIVSRGELVEIGGAFRIPDVMAKSGARLVEVGTTNRTRLGDYERAIGPDTAALMKVHPSNFRIVGFTEEAPGPAVAELARRRGLPALYDLGSGALRLPEHGGVPVVHGEATVADALRQGFDVVTFSGDKLLGGPQAGFIVGAPELIGRIRRNPLYRALRVDKVTLLLVEATLLAYEREREAHDVPAIRMLALPAEEVERRGRAVVAALADAATLGASLVATMSTPGGGSAPGEGLPSWAIALAPAGVAPDRVLAWLRAHEPAIVARIENDAVLLDLRTVAPDEDAALIAALSRPLPR